jgi:hypothetical protein
MDKPPGKRADVKKFDPVSKQAKHASMAEIQAFGVARSLGANVRGAKAEAPGILASAKEMFPAPPSPVPKKKSPLARLKAWFRP